MSRSISRYALIALSILGSATLLFSCGKKHTSVNYDYETLLTESSENRTITMMENGQRSYVFSAPLIEGYSMATNPYQEFRRGIFMTTFMSDSLSLVDATIKAQYAIYYERQKLWEAKGNVVINKFNRSEKDTTVTDTTKIYTQQLFWNATTEKIYSNVDTKVLQKDGWHFGVGFEADEGLKNIHFRRYSSEVEFDATPAPKADKGEESDVQAESKSEPKSEDKGASKDSKKEESLSRDARAKIATSQPMQKIDGKAQSEIGLKAQGAKAAQGAKSTPDRKGVESSVQMRPTSQQDRVQLGATAGPDRKVQDAVRPTMELNSRISNLKMESGSELKRPDFERDSQLNAETSKKK